MVNEDILTALNNAVNKGEPLDHAIQVIIQSGYNPQEVKEAAQYIGRGVLPLLEPRRNEPSIPQRDFSLTDLNTPDIPDIQPKTAQIFSSGEVLPGNYTPQNFLKDHQVTASEQAEKPKRKKSYIMEILLLIALLMLIGLLAATIIFKDAILNFLS